MLFHGMKQVSNLIPRDSDDVQRLRRELSLLQAELEKYRRESRKSRQQMEELRNDHDRILDLLPIGCIILDEMGRILKINHAGASMLGGERSRLTGMQFTAWLAEDIRLQFLGSLQQAFVSCGHFVVETSSMASNDILCNIRLECNIMQGGGAAKHPSCHMFMTDLRQHNKENEDASLTSSVIGDTMDGIMIIDTYGTIRSVNPSFEKITGYSAAEAAGNTPALLEPNCFDKGFFTTMWEELGINGQWQGDVWSRHKSGDIYPAWLNIGAVKNNQRRTIHYVGVLSSPRINTFIQKLFVERLQYLAYNDALTGIPNRRLFLDRLNLHLSQARRVRQMLAVLFVDLDQLKQVNDTMGHKAGDELLVGMTERMKSCLRESDTLARFGGDEFTIILPAIPDDDAAIHVATKFLECCAKPMSINGKELNVTASIGISIFPEDGEEAGDLVSRADSAMYHAKKEGGNGYLRYTGETGSSRVLQ